MTRLLAKAAASLLLVVLAARAAPGPVELPLLEASGAVEGGFDTACVLGDSGALGGGNASPRGVVVRGRDLLLLGGPTPFLLRTAEAALPASAANANASAASVVSFSNSAAASLALIRPTLNGAELLSVDRLAGGSGGGATGVRVLDLPLGGQGLAIGATALDGGGALVLRDEAAEPFAIVDDDATGALRVNGTGSCGIAPRGGYSWVAVASGASGGPARGLTVAARWSKAALATEVVLLNLNSSAVPAGGSRLAPAAVVASAVVPGNSSAPLIGVSVADVYGDGVPAVLLVFSDSTMQVLWLGLGAAPLYLAATFALDPVGAAAARWRSVAVGAWLAPGATVLPAEAQILGMRAPPDAPPSALRVSALVFGRPEHWLRRRASLAGLRAQQELKTTYADDGPNVANLTAPLDVERVKAILASTHSNAFLNDVCDCTPSPPAWACSPLYGYLDFVRLLDATRTFAVDGRQVRIMLGLFPPSEALMPAPSACRAPPDSPLTPFDEAALFAGQNYTQYATWGVLAGLLAEQYPHLVAMDIDDFDINVRPGDATVFTGQDVALITAGMRLRAPWMMFSSVVYGPFTAVPDLALVLDAPVFFFRNAGSDADSEGAGPCAAASCPWGPLVRHRTGGCLAGVCSEPTTFNARAEVDAVRAGLPAGRMLITGYYATMHSSLGQPTARYVSRLLQSLAMQDGVAGVMTYTLKSALEPCVGGPLFDNGGGGDLQHSLGCIVAAAYGALAGAGTAPTPAPAPAAAAAAGSFSASTLAVSSIASALGGAALAAFAAFLAARTGAGDGERVRGGELGEKLLVN
jgi:hypothetical protein